MRRPGLFGLALAAAVLPIAVAAVRAIERGWLPVGDNGYFALRARDVLTEHHPLLGTWTSASTGTGTNFNNPGPLLFDLFALPAKLVDSGAGVVAGAALVNIASVVAIGLVARRRGGPAVAAATLLVAAVLCWSMGSELLFDPWQPHSLLLPFLLTLVLVWSLADGDVAVAPAAAGVASLVVQTHLSYAILIAALGGWGLVMLTLRLRRERPERGALRRTAIVTLAVVAVCWSQPLVEQVTADGEGNLTRLATNVGDSTETTIGYGTGTGLAASVLSLPPFWLRPSFDEALLPPDDATGPVEEQRRPDLPSGGAAALSLVVLAVALLAAGVASRRWAAVGTAGVAVAAGLITAGSLPLTGLGISPHQLRWLWPVGAFATLTLLLAVARAAPSMAAAVLTGLTVVVALANLPHHNPRSGPSSDVDAIPVVARLHHEMAALDDLGPLLVDLSGVRFAEPYSGAVFAELQRRGIEFVVDDAVDRRQVGESRSFERGDAERFLMIREGDAALDAPAGTERVALVEGLDGDEQRALARARQEVAARLEDLGRVPLNDRGERAVANGRLPILQRQLDDGVLDVDALLEWREVDAVVAGDMLELDDGDRPLFERYTELQRRWDRQTVALFVGDIDDRPAAGS